MVGHERAANQIKLSAGAQLQLFILAPQQRRLDRPRQHQQQPIRLERLLDKIVGADLDRFDSRFDRPVPADHDHGNSGHFSAQPTQDLDPVELTVLQPDIEDDEGRLAGMQLTQRLGAVGRLPGGVTLVFKHSRNQHADVGFVVNDQNVMRHERQYSHPPRPAARRG